MKLTLFFISNLIVLYTTNTTYAQKESTRSASEFRLYSGMPFTNIQAVYSHPLFDFTEYYDLDPVENIYLGIEYVFKRPRYNLAVAWSMDATSYFNRGKAEFQYNTKGVVKLLLGIRNSPYYIRLEELHDDMIRPNTGRFYEYSSYGLDAHKYFMYKIQQKANNLHYYAGLNVYSYKQRRLAFQFQFISGLNKVSPEHPYLSFTLKEKNSNLIWKQEYLVKSKYNLFLEASFEPGFKLIENSKRSLWLFMQSYLRLFNQSLDYTYKQYYYTSQLHSTYTYNSKNRFLTFSIEFGLIMKHN